MLDCTCNSGNTTPCRATLPADTVLLTQSPQASQALTRATLGPKSEFHNATRNICVGDLHCWQWHWPWSSVMLAHEI